MFKSLAPPDPKKMMTFFLENMRATIKRVFDFANLLPGLTNARSVSIVIGCAGYIESAEQSSRTAEQNKIDGSTEHDCRM